MHDGGRPSEHTQRKRIQRCLLCVALLCAVAAVACERNEDPRRGAVATVEEFDETEASRSLPDYVATAARSLLARDIDELVRQVAWTEVGCVSDTSSGFPEYPECLEGESDGDPALVLPFVEGETEFMRDADVPDRLANLLRDELVLCRITGAESDFYGLEMRDIDQTEEDVLLDLVFGISRDGIEAMSRRASLPGEHVGCDVT